MAGYYHAWARAKAEQGINVYQLRREINAERRQMTRERERQALITRELERQERTRLVREPD